MISGTLLGALVGLALGVGAYTFVYAKGYSYLSNNPQACANCHVMENQYSGWLKSSHHSVATCNDCHTPHNLVGKYATKAENGFWHSFYFTTGLYPENIQAREKSRRITEDACRVEQVFGSIAASLVEQSAAARQIAAAVESVASLADETERSASVVAGEVDTLDRTARELSQAVRSFRLA